MLQHGGRLAGKGPAGGVRGAHVAGRRIEIVEGCSETGVYGRLITETRRLVEIDHVDAVVGGFGFSDGIVFRELARRYPTVPFLLVVSAAREATAHATGREPLSVRARHRAGHRRARDLRVSDARLAARRRRGRVHVQWLGRCWGIHARSSVPSGAPPSASGRPSCYGAPASLLKQVPASVDGIVVLSAYGSYGSPVPFIRGYLARHPDAPRSLLLGLWMFPPLDTAPFASLWPDLRGVVARLSGVPNLSSAVGRGLPQCIRAGVPGPAAERREQSRRAAVLDCGGSPAAVAREDAWSDRRGARRLARGARAR